MSRAGEWRGAGEELDRLVAERVMGWNPYHAERTYLSPTGIIRNVSRYASEPHAFWPSLRIADAWEVVERMSSTTKEHWTLEHGSCFERATFAYEGGRELPWKEGEHVGEATTMPLAICLAALRAVGEGE